MEPSIWQKWASRQVSVGGVADRLAQLVEPRSTVREVVGLNPGRTNTHGF